MLPGPSTPAASGLGRWRRGSDLRQSRDPAESRGAGSGGGQDAGQVGDGGGEIELGGGLVTPEVPSLAQTQLHQPGQTMLHGLAEVAIGCESRTVLERAGGPQQGFLRVQANLPPAPRCRSHTAGTQRTGRTERRVKVERAPGRLCPGSRGIEAVAAHGTCHLTRRTGAGTRRQVNLEILLGEVRAGGSFAHFGDQGAPGIGKLLPGVAIPIGRIGDGCGHRQPGMAFALGHQLQRALGIRGIAGQHRHGGDELAGASRARVYGNGRLVAVKTLAATLAPVAHLGVMYGHNAVPAHPLFEVYAGRRPGHILVQQLAQELGRGHDLAPVRAVGRTASLGVPGRRQQAVRIGHDLGQERLPGRGLIPVDLRRALDTGRQVAGIALPRGPGGQLPILHPGQRPEQLADAVRQQIVGVLHRPTPLDGRRIQGHLQAAAAQQAPRPGQFQAAPKQRAHLRMQHQLRPEMLQRTLAGTLWVGPHLHLHPQRYLPAQVHRGPAVRLRITDLVMRLQEQGGGQQAGRHAAPAIVPAVEGREVLIPKQLPPQPGQPPVETVPPHQIQVQMVRFKQAALI